MGAIKKPGFSASGFTAQLSFAEKVGFFIPGDSPLTARGFASLRSMNLKSHLLYKRQFVSQVTINYTPAHQILIYVNFFQKNLRSANNFSYQIGRKKIK